MIQQGQKPAKQVSEKRNWRPLVSFTLRQDSISFIFISSVSYFLISFLTVIFNTMEKTHSSIVVHLHPIVALGISDQWTKKKMNSTDSNIKVCFSFMLFI